MNLIKKYKAILLIVVPVIILVLIRATGTYHFRTDAKKLAEPSFSGSNIMTSEKLDQIDGDILIINLGKDVIQHNYKKAVIKTISPDSILYKDNLRLISEHKGAVILTASESAISVRIWMLLSQMGLRNLFVLSADPDPEVLKYEFRPDTMARPEL